MSNCNWEEICAFSSMIEYHRFIQWLEEQVEQNICEELIEHGKLPSEWDDRLFRCKKSSNVWKLSCPDPGYFPGSWVPI